MNDSVQRPQNSTEPASSVAAGTAQADRLVLYCIAVHLLLLSYHGLAIFSPCIFMLFF